MSEILIRKDGSGSIAFDNGPGVDPAKIDGIVHQHVLLREDGFLTGQVTSGAVREGERHAIEMGLLPDDFTEKELAMGGFPSHFEKWRISGRESGLYVISSLSTFIELADSEEGGEIREGATTAIGKPKILYVANFHDEASGREMGRYEKSLEEKDKGLATTTEENDEHAANIAIAAGAGVLMLLTAEVEGFIYKGKKLDEIHVDDIAKYLEYVRKHARPGSNGRLSKGGMKTKLLGAEKAAKAGIRVVIGNSFEDSRRILEENAGTWVVQ